MALAVRPQHLPIPARGLDVSHGYEHDFKEEPLCTREALRTAEIFEMSRTAGAVYPMLERWVSELDWQGRPLRFGEGFVHDTKWRPPYGIWESSDDSAEPQWWLGSESKKQKIIDIVNASIVADSDMGDSLRNAYKWYAAAPGPGMRILWAWDTSSQGDRGISHHFRAFAGGMNAFSYWSPQQAERCVLHSECVEHAEMGAECMRQTMASWTAPFKVELERVFPRITGCGVSWGLCFGTYICAVKMGLIEPSGTKL